jgi:cytochrome c2
MPLSEFGSLNLGQRDRRGKTLHADAEASFAAFIANLRGKIPGNKMIFGGIKDQTEIANLWFYLSHFNVDGSSK